MAEFFEYTAPQWRGLNMRQLKVDEAYVLPQSLFSKKCFLYVLSEECYTCPFTKLAEIEPNSSADSAILHALPLNVAHALQFKIFEQDLGKYDFGNESALCHLLDNIQMREFGVYNFTVQSNGSCGLITDKTGVNVNLSLVSVFLLCFFILSFMRITWCAWKRFRYDELAEVANTSDRPIPVKSQSRMRSLDAFRGLAIVLMIFVNSGGGDYWWIEHAPWNGLHLADIVFPSFLWIMGVCIPISIKSQLNRGVHKGVIIRRIIWRSLKLFLIGLCLNSINGPNLEQLRIMGVLQRFGIAYLVCGVLHTIFAKGNIILPQSTWKRVMHDTILLRNELIIMLILIITYLSIIFGLNVPNCPKGYLGPGGKHANAAYPNCIGGANGYIDLLILGNAQSIFPTAKYIYDSKAFDPQGVFGCLLTVVQVQLGILAGVIILVYAEWQSRIKRWLVWSLCLGLLAGALCTFSKEDGIIPLNKNLWSLSFVCVTAALAFLVLSLLYWLIDVRRWWSGYPFVESGMNAIIMYVGHTIMHKMLPWHWKIGEMNTHFVLLLEAVWNTLLWIAIALYLDYKQFYYSL